MTAGLRLQLEVETPHNCVVGNVSRETETRIDWITQSTTTAGSKSVEFALPTETVPGGDEFDTVFQRSGDTLYRTSCNVRRDCPCRCIEELGHPISDIKAHEGMLHVTFHVPNSSKAEQVVRELREQFEHVTLQCVSWARKTPKGNAIALVDQARFTDRQHEVLQTAYEMGYFEYPRTANARDVADELAIDPSTFAEHLAAAQSKLMDAIVASTD